MDQTTKPLLIPPQFALYAEKHGIFELYQVKKLITKFFGLIFVTLLQIANAG